MKIEMQVCSLEQSIKLKKLSIKQDSHFFWVDRKEKSKLVYAKSVEFLNSLPIYSAFTVAELGIMLDSETYTQRTGSEDSKYANWEWINDGNETGSGLFGYEVFARADMLINCLESGSLSAETCNNRLLAEVSFNAKALCRGGI